MDIPDSFDKFIDSIPDDLPDEIAGHLASALLRAALVLLGGDVAIIVCQHNPNCDSPTCTASAVGSYMPAVRTGFSDEGAVHLAGLPAFLDTARGVLFALGVAVAVEAVPGEAHRPDHEVVFLVVDQVHALVQLPLRFAAEPFDQLPFKGGGLVLRVAGVDGHPPVDGAVPVVVHRP